MSFFVYFSVIVPAQYRVIVRKEITNSCDIQLEVVWVVSISATWQLLCMENGVHLETLSCPKETELHVMEDAFVRSYKSNYSSYRVPLYRLVLSIYFSTTDLVHDHAAEQSTFFLSVIKYVTIDFVFSLPLFSPCFNHELYRAKIPVAL